MKIVTRYIMKEIMGPLLFGFLAFTSIFSGVTFLNLLRDADRYQFTIWFIIKLLILRMPEYMLQAAPVAVLLGALLGLGNLTGHSETIAMRAGGLSYKRLAIPVVIIGFIVMMVGIGFNEFVIPNARRSYDDMKHNVSQEAEQTIWHFSKEFFKKDNLERTLYAKRYDLKSKTLFQVNIQEFADGKLARTVEASKMYWKGQNWFFDEGRIYEFFPDNFYPIEVKRGRVKYDLQLTPTQIEQMKEDPDNKSITELGKLIRFLPKESNELPSLWVTYHQMFAIPTASLVLALLGAPLALRPQRRSNAAGFGLCIIFIIVWYVLMGIGAYLGNKGVVSPLLGAWLPNIVLAGYGILVYRNIKS